MAPATHPEPGLGATHSLLHRLCPRPSKLLPGLWRPCSTQPPLQSPFSSHPPPPPLQGSSCQAPLAFSSLPPRHPFQSSLWCNYMFSDLFPITSPSEIQRALNKNSREAEANTPGRGKAQSTGDGTPRATHQPPAGMGRGAKCFRRRRSKSHKESKRSSDPAVALPARAAEATVRKTRGEVYAQNHRLSLMVKNKQTNKVSKPPTSQGWLVAWSSSCHWRPVRSERVPADPQ